MSYSYGICNFSQKNSWKLAVITGLKFVVISYVTSAPSHIATEEGDHFSQDVVDNNFSRRF